MSSLKTLLGLDTTAAELKKAFQDAPAPVMDRPRDFGVE